ncbi:hypothetical protein [Polyangium sp. 6x1]|uniref:hypothetical protein n=1 Tax=Polyangium sp. 6x1 TaxID=3042689 RepID=UPI0024829C14|nr:hypothetical protein [Polyangium sp. 6x1]MDI1451069.1 hypothetical protein [Polyangium sp. 6x1]
MSSCRLFGNDATDAIAAELRVFAYPILASALLVAGCSSDLGRSPPASMDGTEAVHIGRPRRANAPACGAISRGVSRLCQDPALGSVKDAGIVGRTAEYWWLCRAGECPRDDISYVGLDYGNFPFASVGEYFFAVVAPGYEDGGFRDGAPGNLSDRRASCVPGDLGQGDSVDDRTIVIAAFEPGVFTVFSPASAGTHDKSWMDSGFMSIALAPFDATPDGKYVLAICPSSASSRCDCAFEPFFVEPAQADAGASNPEAGTP